MRKIYSSFRGLFIFKNYKIAFPKAGAFRKVFISFLLLFFIGFNNILFAQPVPASAWEYSRVITLTPATPLADFQVKITLTAAQQAGMKADGSDLRFYAGTTACSFWIEKWNTSGTSVIWVKVPTVNTSALTMYYGNPSATSAVSPGSDVFDDFDDFTAPLGSKWDQNQSGDASITQLGTEVTLSTGSNDNMVSISSLITPASPSFFIETKHKEGAYGRNRFYVGTTVNSLNTLETGFYSNGVSTSANVFSGSPKAATVSANICYISAWQITDGATSTYQWSTSDFNTGTSIDAQPPASTASLIRAIYIMLNEKANTSTTVDWIRVRKSTGAGEISATVEPQVQLAPVINNFSPSSVCAGNTATIIINGDNFDNVLASGVAINDVSATSIIINSRKQITATIPSGISTGKITITNPGGSVTSLSNLVVNPLPAQFALTGGGGRCSDGVGLAIGLSNSETGVSYELMKDANSIGSTGIKITGNSGSAISFPSQTASGYYTVVATSSAGCTQAMTGSATITVSTVTAFTVAPATAGYCAGTSGVPIGLSKSEPGVNYQLYRGAAAIGAPVTGTGDVITFGNQPAGTYTVEASNASCTKLMTGSAVITINPLPSGTLTATETSGATNDNKICIGANVTFTASTDPSFTNYNFKVNNTSKQNTASNTFSTTLLTNNQTITVDVTNSAGCTATFTPNPITITVNPLPTGTITTSAASVCQGDPVTFTANVSNGSNYKFYVNMVQKYEGVLNTFPITLNQGDIVTATVTNTNGCDVTLTAPSVTVNPFPAAAGTISGSTTVCQGQKAVTYTVPAINNVVATGGYIWTLPTGATVVTNSNKVTVDFSNTAVNGNISVVGHNACGDGTSSSLYVKVNPLSTASIDGNTIICQNDVSPTITFTAAIGTAPYTFSYNINGGATQTVTSTGNTATITAPTINAGTYTYNLTGVKDASPTTCFNAITGSFVSVKVNPLPTASISGNTTVCQNGTNPTITFTGANGTAPYKFSYNINEGSIQTVISAGNTATITAPTNAGTLTYNLVGVQDASTTTCSNTIIGSSVVVNVNPLATATIENDAKKAECLNSTTKPGIIFTGIGGTAPYTFTYNIDGGTNKTVTTTSGNSVIVSAPTTVAGTFTYNLVSVKDKSSTACLNPQTGSAIVTINPLPVPVLIGPDQICPDQTLDYSTQSGDGIHNYIWTINNGAVIAGGGVGTMNSTARVHWNNNTSPKSIYVNYTDNNGCAGNTSVSVISKLPTAPVISSGPKAVCINSTGNVYVTQPGFTDYNWSISAGGTITDQTDNKATVTWNTSGPQSISVNFNSGTCSAPSPTVYPVTVNPLPTATIAVDKVSVCQGLASPVITFTGAGGTAPYTFTYKINGVVQSVITSSGNSKTVTVPTSSAGLFTYDLVSVQDGSSTACVQNQTGSVTVTVNTLSTASISSDVSVCQNSTAPDITFTGSNGKAPYTFTYAINGSNKTITTITGNSITVAGPTNNTGTFVYKLVSVSDANGCSQVATGTATVTVNPLPTATINGPASVCLNDAANITFTGAGGTAPYTFSYNIGGSSNQTVKTLSGNSVTVPVTTTTAGSFTYNLISVQDASSASCIQNQTGVSTIVVNPVSVGGTISGSTTVCAGSNGTLTLSGETGSVLRWESSIDGTTWLPITNATNSLNYANLTTTTYFRAVVQSGVCSPSNSGTATITVNTANGGTVAGTKTVCAGYSGAVTLTGNSGSVIQWESSIDNGLNWVIDATNHTYYVNYTNIPQTTWFRAYSQNSPCLPTYSTIAIVTVNDRPTGSISGTAAICTGVSTTLTLTLKGAGTINGTLSDGTAFSGTAGTVSLTVSPTATTTYTIKALKDANTCIAVDADKTGSATVSVNTTPTPVVITPGNSNICNGTILPLTAVFNTVSKGAPSVAHTISLSIPDNSSVGVVDSIQMAGIPSNAIIDSIEVNFNIHHTWVGDLGINLKAPNGKVLTLAQSLSGSNCLNTTISSNTSKYAPIYPAGTEPYTGIYAHEQAKDDGATIIAGNRANTFLFSDLFGTANGWWKFSVWDRSEGDIGTFDSWSLTIHYTVPVDPVPVAWYPVAGLYTDASATVAYTGQTLGTVYAKPGNTTTYSTSTNLTACTSSSSVTVSVTPPPAVTVSADYCAVEGQVQLTASSVPDATSYTWNTGAIGQVTIVDEAQLYVVIATTAEGCVGTGQISVAQELVRNGNFEAGNTGFTTQYSYAPGPGNNVNNPWSLQPEGMYTVDTSAYNYHRNFFGKDHTTPAQTGKFMMINGYASSSSAVIWQQTVTVLPNTNYYYSAWAMNLNPGSPARLQFEVNGKKIGTIAELGGAPKPIKQDQVNINNWGRFYYGNTDGWNSGSATTAVIRIINLNPELEGNDFGLDDISFATLSTFITKTSDLQSDNQTVCKGIPINNIIYRVGSGGSGPSVTGLPDGVTFTYNGISLIISGAPIAPIGIYNYTVKTESCGTKNPTTVSGSITITAQIATLFSPAGTDTQTPCINSPITPIKYKIGGTATSASVNTSLLPTGASGNFDASTGILTISGTPSVAGLFTYKVITSGACIPDTITGTIDVKIDKINNTLGNDAQTVCINTAIKDIAYQLSGTATGATISVSPAATWLTGSYNAGVYTISGTPTVSGTFNYTVTTNGSCAAAAATGTITVTPDATISLTSTSKSDAQTVCINSAITNITYATGGGGNDAKITAGSLPTGVSAGFSGGIFTISGIPTESGTFNYTIGTEGTCVQATKSGIITVNPEVVGGTLSSSYTPGCSSANGTLTLNGSTGSVKNWESSPNGAIGSWVNIPNTTTTYNFTGITQATFYRAVIDGGGHCDDAISTAISIGAHSLWSGSQSTDWNNANNWADGTVPVPSSSCPDVIIPKVATNYPVIGSGIAAVNNININSGASLTVTGGTLQIAGTITNQGTFDVSKGTIELNGSSAQTIGVNSFLNNAVNSLIINNATGVTLNGPIDIYRSLNFGTTGKNLNTNSNLTIKSTATETAWIGDMTGKAITGDVTVERYINTLEHGKSWEFLAIPTKGQTVKQSWMENGDLTSTGYGTQIISPWGTAAGFDVTRPQQPSMKYFDPNSSLGWTGITNTGNQIYDIRGYMLFVRGDRNVDGVINKTANATTLRTKGQLWKGPVNIPVVPVGTSLFASVGNPFASAINMKTVMAQSNNVDEFFTVWDPYAYGSYGVGTYKTCAKNAVGDYEITPGGQKNNLIQSGQAFFVQITNGSGNVKFDESSKASSSSITFFRPEGIPGRIAQLRTNLFSVSANGSTTLADGTMQQFSDDYSNGIDEKDARKFLNGSENLSIRSAGKNLIVERRHTLNQEDTVFYNLASVKAQNYRFEFTATGLSANGLQGFVEDTYLEARTPLNLEGKTQLNFAVTNVAASYAANRFRIVFKTVAALPVTFVSVKAYAKNTDIAVEWKVENESNMQQYEVERSIDGSKFVKSATIKATNRGAGSYSWLDQHATPGYNYYRIRSIDLDGKANYTKTMKVLMGSIASEIVIYPNPITNGIVNLRFTNQPAGKYGIRLLNPLGQVIISKQVERAEGNSAESIKWDYNLAHGVYQLEVTKPDGEVKVIKVMY